VAGSEPRLSLDVDGETLSEVMDPALRLSLDADAAMGRRAAGLAWRLSMDREALRGDGEADPTGSFLASVLPPRDPVGHDGGGQAPKTRLVVEQEGK
jgi:hypothetical protein